MHFKSPKNYWKILNSIDKSPPKNSPSLNDFYNHFKSVNQQNEHLEQCELRHEVNTNFENESNAAS